MTATASSSARDNSGRKATAVVRGLTWDHPRAYEGLFAEAERFNKTQTDLQIVWDKHSLRAFEATPIAELAARYDLIIMDHPFVGDAALSGCLCDLKQHAVALDLDEIEADTIGPSFASYRFADGLWALPIDAACQTSASRSDVLSRLGLSSPRTLDELLAFAQRAPIALALATPHAFMNYLTICGMLGADISGDAGSIAPPDIGAEAVRILRLLAQAAPDEAKSWSSIATLDAMASRDDLAYSPMAFCFNSYARRGGMRALSFGDVPAMRRNGAIEGSVAGGAGLAISASCNDIAAALAALRHFAGASAQRRIAVDGGQPSRISVWRDEAADRANGGFFSGCAGAMQRSVLRPRYAGYMALQDGAGELLLDDIRNSGADAASVAAAIERMHRDTRRNAHQSSVQ